MARKNNPRFLREKQWGNNRMRMYCGKKHIRFQWARKLQLLEKVESFHKNVEIAKKGRLVTRGPGSMNCYAYGSTLLPIVFPAGNRNIAKKKIL